MCITRLHVGEKKTRHRNPCSRITCVGLNGVTLKKSAQSTIQKQVYTYICLRSSLLKLIIGKHLMTSIYHDLLSLNPAS